MTIRYNVTFEYETQPPLTHRGTVTAKSLHTCSSRAIRAAQRALKPGRWSSVVFVALERVETPEMTEGERPSRTVPRPASQLAADGV